MRNITKNKNRSLSSFFYVGPLLLVTCLIAYWPLTFGNYSLKNDAVIYFLPIRYYISNAIQHNFWPFWIPYLNLGYPLHGDMQSGVWNPFVQIISLFGTYSMRTLQLETIFYVFLSGISMFFLLKHFKFQKGICAFISVAYMLCGFNSDSAQFIYWISGTAFLPLVILYFYKALNDASWQSSVICSFFLFLFFSTAYPGEFILLAYVMLALLIWFCITTNAFKNKRLILSYIKLLVLITIIFLFLASPAILSYLTFLPFLHRGNGVSYDLALSNALHPGFLFSYFTPLAVWKPPFSSDTDPLGRNCYIGIIPFVLLVCGLFFKTNDKFIRFCKWSFFIFLLFSFGEIGLLRSISYYTLPLMDTFRHPSFAKLFFNFFGCLLAAFFLQNAHIQRPYLRVRAFYFVIFCLTLILSWGLFFSNQSLILSAFKSGSVNTRSLINFYDSSSFSDLIFINILIQVPFCFILYYAFVKKIDINVLALASIINCIIMAMLFQPFTVVRKESVVAFQDVIKSYEKNGFPKPSLTATINQNSINNKDSILKYGPLPLFGKKIAHTFNFQNPGRLNTQEEFWNNESLRSAVFTYPLLFKADTAFLINEILNFSSLTNKKIAVVQDSSLKTYINRIQKDNTFSAYFESYSPNEWTINISTNEEGFFCLLQNYFPLWELKIDKIPTKPQICNITFIGFHIPKGNHLITLKYNGQVYKVLLLLSWLASISIIVWLTIRLIKNTFSIS